MTATAGIKPEIKRGNLKKICGLNGFATVQKLASKIGYARGTIYYAVRWPSRYPVAYTTICDALPRREA